MRLRGVSIGFTDCDQDVAQEFNRWYDLDHVPENIALPELLGARRYVATPDLRAQRSAQGIPALHDGGAYCAIYWIGVDDIQSAGARMGELFDRLRGQRRIFRKARIVHSDRCRLLRAYAGKNAPPLDPDAVPYLAHSGLIIAFSEVVERSRRAELEDWWDNVHIPDILSVPGLLGALRFESAQPDMAGRFLLLFLTEGDPRVAQENVSKASPQWLAQGRTYPPDRRPHRSLFSGTYRAITPLQYGFLSTWTR